MHPELGKFLRNQFLIRKMIFKIQSSKLYSRFLSLISFITLFVPFFLSGQGSLSGKYSHSTIGELHKKVDFESIIFHENNNFEYEYSFFNYRFGKGIYSVKQDSLLLYFEKYDSFSKNKIRIIDSSFSNSDSIIIKLKINYEDSLPLQFANVVANRDSSILTPNFLVGKSSNANGEAQLILKKDTGQIWLAVFFIGIEQTQFKLSGDRNYNLIIDTYKSNYGRINGEVWKYRIKKLKKDELCLKILTLIKSH